MPLTRNTSTDPNPAGPNPAGPNPTDCDRAWTPCAVFASIGYAVIVTGVDGRVTCMNPIAESFTGW